MGRRTGVKSRDAVTSRILPRNFLEKPVTQAKLVSCLRETLSRAAAQGLPGEP